MVKLITNNIKRISILLILCFSVASNIDNIYSENYRIEDIYISNTIDDAVQKLLDLYKTYVCDDLDVSGTILYFYKKDNDSISVCRLLSTVNTKNPNITTQQIRQNKNNVNINHVEDYISDNYDEMNFCYSNRNKINENTLSIQGHIKQYKQDGNNPANSIHTEHVLCHAILSMLKQQEEKSKNNDTQDKYIAFVIKNKMCPGCHKIMEDIVAKYKNIKIIALCINTGSIEEQLNTIQPKTINDYYIKFCDYVLFPHINLVNRILFGACECSQLYAYNNFSCAISCSVVPCKNDDELKSQSVVVTTVNAKKNISPIIIQTNIANDKICEISGSIINYIQKDIRTINSLFYRKYDN